MQPPPYDSRNAIIPWAVFISVCMGILARIRFGIDLFDESYYIATPLRFALGAKPFIDELHFSQTAALFTALPIKGYLAWGGTNGLVLFSRHLFVFFNVAVALGLWGILTPLVGGAVTALLAAFYVLFIPVMSPVLSYNALMLGFFTLGLALSWRSLREPRSDYAAVGSGVCFSLAALAYPTIALVAIGVAIHKLVKERRQGLAFCLGFIPATLLLIIVLDGHISRLYDVLEFVRHYDPDRKFDPLKVLIPIDPFLRGGWRLPAMAVLVYSLFETGRVSRERFRLGITLLPMVLFLFAHPRLGGLGQADFIVYLGTVPLMLMLLLHRKAGWIELFGRVAFPSWCAAFVCGMSSHMGVSAVSVGIFPAALVGLYWIANHSRTAASMGFSVLFLLSYWRSGYGEITPNIYALADRLNDGPYRGLRTSPEKAELIRSLQRDLLKAEEREPTSVISYPYLPAIYLLAPLPVPYPTLFATNCEGVNEKHCRAKADLFVIFEEDGLHKIRAQKEFSLLQDGYHRIAETKVYTIYVNTPPRAN